ncbi:hypothetical protein YERSI8AC_260013 [Enterobacterales bacterium 8AC]|nr:hypothetical protein YERSI8AC_260013 [Enterobacterales bacterium 8AC]
MKAPKLDQLVVCPKEGSVKRLQNQRTIAVRMVIAITQQIIERILPNYISPIGLKMLLIQLKCSPRGAALHSYYPSYIKLHARWFSSNAPI